MSKKFSASDSFEELFSPKKKNNFIVQEYKEDNSVGSSFEKITKNIDEPKKEERITPSSFEKLTSKIKEEIHAPRAPIEMVLEPEPESPNEDLKKEKSASINPKRIFKFLRKLRTWVASPFISKMIEELNKRLLAFENKYDSKIADFSYQLYQQSPRGGLGIGSAIATREIIKTISEAPKYYNNTDQDIETGILVTVSENYLLDQTTTTIKPISSILEEPIGITKEIIPTMGEKEIIKEGTFVSSLNTVLVPMGTPVYSDGLGGVTFINSMWRVGKTVNQAMNGKIYFKIEKEIGSSSSEADFIGLPSS